MCKSFRAAAHTEAVKAAEPAVYAFPSIVGSLQKGHGLYASSRCSRIHVRASLFSAPKFLNVRNANALLSIFPHDPSARCEDCKKAQIFLEYFPLYIRDKKYRIEHTCG